jgi:hypothetical protein
MKTSNLTPKTKIQIKYPELSYRYPRPTNEPTHRKHVYLQTGGPLRGYIETSGRNRKQAMTRILSSAQ